MVWRWLGNWVWVQSCNKKSAFGGGQARHFRNIPSGRQTIFCPAYEIGIVYPVNRCLRGHLSKIPGELFSFITAASTYMAEPYSPVVERASLPVGEQPSLSIARSRYIVFGLLIVVGVAADLLTKEWVFGWRGSPGQLPPWWLIESYVGIETAVNQGALFGMGQGQGWLFAILSLFALVGICIWLFVFKAAQSKWMLVAMGLVTGGIIGNLYDRLGIPKLPIEFRGGVRDWILFRYQDYVWPNFNIADSLLVAGAIMLAIHSLFLMPAEPAKAETKQ